MPASQDRTVRKNRIVEPPRIARRFTISEAPAKRPPQPRFPFLLCDSGGGVWGGGVSLYLNLSVCVTGVIMRPVHEVRNRLKFCIYLARFLEISEKIGEEIRASCGSVVRGLSAAVWVILVVATWIDGSQRRDRRKKFCWYICWYFDD
ncbi:MAG: hypothetical protein HQM06_14045 [Magnetococcales bacterium]|nr:hypothetical protein [Magnetococcales bacterium]